MVINKNKPAEWHGKHILKCVHCFGRSEMYYAMYCNVIRETKSGKLLIDVFGRRYRHVSGVRRLYVEPYKVREYKDHFKD